MLPLHTSSHIASPLIFLSLLSHRCNLTSYIDNTLHMLFQAQKHPQSAQPEPVDIPMTAPSPAHSRQSSLHSFWALPKTSSRPTSSYLSQPPQPLSPPILIEAIGCSSCDTSLVDDSGDSMDLDEVDVSGGLSGFECSQCQKPFCHNCSISNLGSQRHCLRCAGQKRWIGGLGWVTA